MTGSFTFLKQPENVTVTVNEAAKMWCLFNGTADEIPWWNINGSSYSIITLPMGLILSIKNNGYVLTIARVTPEWNFTRFQCQVQIDGKTHFSRSGFLVVGKLKVFFFFFK